MTKLCKRLGMGLAAAALLLGFAGLQGVGETQAQTNPDGVFTGTVMIDGEAAADGTTVTAMVGETTCATGQVGMDGPASGRYVLRVPQSCAGDGELSFMVGDMMAMETAPFSNSGLNTVNLTAMTPTPEPTAEPTAMPTEEPTEEPTEPEEPTEEPTAMETEEPTEEPTAMPTEDDTAMGGGGETPGAPSTGTGLASGSTTTTTLAAALGALALAVTLGGLALARRRG